MTTHDLYDTWTGSVRPHCPRHVCGRSLMAVISYTSSNTAVSREHDTPVWWCPDHGIIYLRLED